MFVVFRKGVAPDHLVRAGDGIEVLGMDGGNVKLRVSKAGRYQLETASGKTGDFVFKDVPEAAEIAGEWTVGFPKGRGATASVTIDKLADWTESADPGVRYFSGTATYRKSFEIAGSPETLVLDLGRVGEVATVKVNGKEAGILWKQPYSVDIAPFLKDGTNWLEISVTNLWNNRIVGDLQSDTDEDITRTNLRGKFTAKSPLIPSGLIGPVTLRKPLDVAVGLK